jgi:DNA mismatch repair protein MutL
VPTIRILPDDLVDQIAAGEVVERPASVVKELVENAIDAGARRIQIDVEGGGTGLVRVADDGLGMTRDDATLAVRRHATSKVREQADLERIATMGFRGEALPSIASVSRFSLVTRTESDVAATEVRIEGGGVADVRDAARARGTTVTVADLFYNVPARRKFLKSTATESTHVSDVVTRAALSDAGLHVVMTRDGRRVKELVPAPDLAQRALLLFPDERLAWIEGERAEITVRAMLGPPERARSGATGLHVYVNRRPVRDRAIARAVAFAYGSVIPPGRYPVGVVWIELAPTRVDVNVHPQKAEVRFEDARGVLDAITRALAAQLGTAPFRAAAPPPGRGPDFWRDRLSGVLGPSPSSQRIGSPLRPLPSEGSDVSRPEPPTRALPHASSSPTPYFAPPPAPLFTRESLPAEERDARTGAFGGLRVLGQVQRTFLVCEGEHGLVVLDQHAADERVRFHRLRTSYAARTVAVQRLLLPERVELGAQELSVVENEREALSALGLDVAVIGETTAAVRGVPALVRRASPERLLRDVLAELARAGSRAFGDAVDTALATMACHGAIRAGDALSPAEQQELLRSLDEVTDFAGHCAHGRPIVHEISFADLARKVGR